MNTVERCQLCDEHTNHGEDSIVIKTARVRIGPLCEKCADEIRQWVLADCGYDIGQTEKIINAPGGLSDRIESLKTTLAERDRQIAFYVEAITALQADLHAANARRRFCCTYLPLVPPAEAQSAPAWKPEAKIPCEWFDPDAIIDPQRVVPLAYSEQDGVWICRRENPLDYCGVDPKFLRSLPPESPVKMDEIVKVVRRNGTCVYGKVQSIDPSERTFRIYHDGEELTFGFKWDEVTITHYRPVKSP